MLCDLGHVIGITPNVGASPNVWSRYTFVEFEWGMFRLTQQIVCVDLLQQKCCGSWFDDAATLPDQTKLASAERVAFNQSHFKMLGWYIWLD